MATLKLLAGGPESHRRFLLAKGSVQWFRQRSVTSGSLDLFDLRIWLTRPRADYPKAARCDKHQQIYIQLHKFALRLQVARAPCTLLSVVNATRRAVRPCATLCDQSELYCARPRLPYRLLRYIYIRGHSRMCICGCIFTCIYDYTFELGIGVFLHALIHMLSIHSDGALLFSWILCNYSSFHTLLPSIYD